MRQKLFNIANKDYLTKSAYQAYIKHPDGMMTTGAKQTTYYD